MTIPSTHDSVLGGNSKADRYQHRLLAGIFLLSAALLGFEILAVRLVSILLYPVASYLVISLALLGLGASGGLLALRRRESPISGTQIGVCSALFGMAVLLALASVWFASTSLTLSLLLILLLSLPFFLGGYALAAALSLPGFSVSKVYFADLFGAGIGAGAVLLGLSYVGGIQAGLLLTALAFGSSALLHGGGLFSRLAIATGLAFTLAALLIRPPHGIVPIAPKELAHFAQLGEQADWEYQGWDPVARIDVLSLPGDILDLSSSYEYKLVTQDGGAPSLLLHLPGQQAAKAFAEQTIFGLPYWIKPHPRLLIIGLGGGPDLLAALQYDPQKVVALEVNSRMLEIVARQYSDFIGRPLDDPRVETILGDGRHFVQRSQERFDVIQLTGVDTSVAAVGANPNLAENYLYTVEAFQRYFEHLESDGLLSVSFPNVPGLGLRLLTLVEEAFDPPDGSRLKDHVVVSEITGFAHVLTKKSPFTAAEVEILERHFEQSLTSIYFPLYHRLFGTPDPPFFEASEILAAPGLERRNTYTEYLSAVEQGRASEFLASQAQTVSPPTDDQPFFFVLDKWGERSPNLQTLGLTVIILSMACVVLMILPPAVLRRRGLALRGIWPLAGYFLMLGLGFIFIEVNFIQRTALFLGHPSYSLASTLSTLLIASGLGSLASGQWKRPAPTKVIVATLLVAAASLGGNAALRAMTAEMLAMPLLVRLVATVLVIAVPGFFMGFPFPIALNVVKGRHVEFVAWAWGINGMGSVMATILALLLALSWGFQVVFLIAAALYVLAGIAFGASFRRTGEFQPL